MKKFITVILLILALTLQLYCSAMPRNILSSHVSSNNNNAQDNPSWLNVASGSGTTVIRSERAKNVFYTFDGITPAISVFLHNTVSDKLLHSIHAASFSVRSQINSPLII